jgi:hypothetical protein
MMIDEGIERTETKMQPRRLEGTKNFQYKKVFFVSLRAFVVAFSS